jgi:putative endonuclease
MKHERYFDGAPVRPDPARMMRGRVAHSAGCLAEGSVARTYVDQGHELIAERWRGKGGEIDLILRKGDEYVFVEVKKSARHAWAAERISARQIGRICNAALEFCGRLPDGLLTAMRFDAALVDQFGRVEIVENAFGLN